MTHRTTATGLNLRSTPNGVILRSLPRGTAVTVAETRDGWARVEGGWVSAAYLEPIAPPAAPVALMRTPPAGVKPLSFAQREALLGHIEYVRAPTASDPDAIKVTNGWTAQHLVRVDIQQLKRVTGANAAGTVWVHKRVRDQLVALFQAWDDAGLMDRVVSWGGCHNPRMIRGSTTTLSQHAHGSAFDINYLQNPLAKPAAAPGTKGSVWELVPAMVAHGFYWGGWFARVDGMHAEIFEVRG